MHPPVPANEPKRLEALRRYEVLDTPPEQAFDDLAHLAAFICQTPASLVTLVDSHRQWFKARVGWRAPETSREVSFCAHAINDPSSICIVPDATADYRFSGNPLVLAHPNIRFYAGVPLVTSDGYALGTLCVIDFVKRTLTPDQLSALRVLAHEVMAHLELRRQIRLQREAESEMRKLNESLELRVKRRTELLRRSALRAREAVRMRDEFLGAAAHELRTPLTPLKMQFDMARRLLEGKPGQTAAQIPKAIRFLEIADQQISRLTRLVNELLDVTRIQNGRLVLHCEEGDLQELVRNAVEQLSPSAKEAGVEVRVHVQGRDFRGRWDLSRLEQVAVNLLSNALKYGQGKPIDVWIAEDSDVLRFSFEDRGIGMSEEDRRRLFGRFERAPSALKFGGLGLGLFIARQIVEAHGGKISVRSEPGRGSVFSVWLTRSAVQGQEQGQGRRSLCAG